MGLEEAICRLPSTRSPVDTLVNPHNAAQPLALMPAQHSCPPSSMRTAFTKQQQQLTFFNLVHSEVEVILPLIKICSTTALSITLATAF